MRQEILANSVIPAAMPNLLAQATGNAMMVRRYAENITAGIPIANQVKSDRHWRSVGQPNTILNRLCLPHYGY
ncbi:MAG: hypothetical protein WCS87_14855 [Methylococcaceae bacterium]